MVLLMGTPENVHLSLGNPICYAGWEVSSVQFSSASQGFEGVGSLLRDGHLRFRAKYAVPV